MNIWEWVVLIYVNEAHEYMCMTKYEWDIWTYGNEWVVRWSIDVNAAYECIWMTIYEWDICTYGIKWVVRWSIDHLASHGPQVFLVSFFRFSFVPVSCLARERPRVSGAPLSCLITSRPTARRYFAERTWEWEWKIEREGKDIPVPGATSSFLLVSRPTGICFPVRFLFLFARVTAHRCLIVRREWL